MATRPDETDTSPSAERGNPIAALSQTASRFLFFTGKGGVGKTSIACALAVRLADEHRRVLLVSTDPASNLDEVLTARLTSEATPIPTVPGLDALNLDPAAEAAAYRERVISPYRGLLPDAAITSMEEQLSGACTTEIAAFDRFTALLADPAATAHYDHVIFDTAPTGHTLRLLTLPSAWSGFIATNTTGTSCLGPLQGLEAQQDVYRRSVAVLADADRTTLVLVARPEAPALVEAERTRVELGALGIRNQRLVINGVFQAADAADAAASALEAQGRLALAAMPAALRTLPRTLVPLRPENVVGTAALRALSSAVTSAAPSVRRPVPATSYPSLASLVDALAAGGRGVIMSMGKGGVGKTTIAGAIAVELAARGFPVHLSTTDPAAHIAATVGADRVSGLTINRIDPAYETRAYTEHVMTTAGSALDADARALLEEDLRSPCTGEIAVFRAFARTVADGLNGFVVLDTAPTGHTLLLLDASEAYHREVLRNAADLPEEVRALLPRLRDPEFTRVLIVTLPEPTPVHEAERLQADLARAGILPFGWIVNRSLHGVDSRDPVLRARAAAETPFLDPVRLGLAQRAAVVPWSPEEPVGVPALLHLAQSGPITGIAAAPESSSGRGTAR